MKPPPRRILRKPGTEEIDPQAAQDAHEDLVGAVTELLTLGVCHNGVLHENVALVSFVKRELFHGLGRIPKFVTPVKMNPGGVFWTEPHARPREYVYVVTNTATMTVNVLIA